MFANSGCTSHFLLGAFPRDNKVVVLHGGKHVHMKNGETTVATHTAILYFPKIPLPARKCDLFLALQQPLLSLCHLCDAGFAATLDSETVQITKDSIATLSNTRYHTNGLYFTPLQGYPDSTPSPLLTTCQLAMSAPTSAAHTPLQAYIFANRA